MDFPQRINHEINLARTILSEAGEVIVAMRHEGSVEAREKDHFDLVSEADLASHRIIAGGLADAFPSDAFLSEEGDLFDHTKGRCWIADPLDGTANYLHGQDHVGLSLALYIDGVPTIGVVHAPFRDETFWAARGYGAYLGDKPLRITEVRPNERALIATGFPHDRSRFSSTIDRLHPILAEFGDIRRLASPALDICWVCDGRLDGFVDRLMIWDVAAAGLIALEAGADVVLLSDGPEYPEPSDGRDYVIAPRPLSGLLCRLIEHIGRE